MKTVKVAKQSRAINALLEKARQHDVLVKAADGSEFVLSAVGEFTEEIARARQNEKLMSFLETRARKPATLTLEQVKKRLGLRTSRKMPRSTRQ